MLCHQVHVGETLNLGGFFLGGFRGFFLSFCVCGGGGGGGGCVMLLLFCVFLLLFFGGNYFACFFFIYNLDVLHRLKHISR